MRAVSPVGICICFLAGSFAGCFAGELSGDEVIACLGDDCPGALVCSLDDGRCIAADAVCVDVNGGVARHQPDGNRCGDGRICVRGDCQAISCGDGVTSDDEECDDGRENGDGPDACRANCRAPRCGDGIIDSGEACDDGAANANVADACRADCRAPACGDAIIDGDEECDDGDVNSDVDPSACRTSCLSASCGDGVRDAGEECDEGSENSSSLSDACRLDCRAPRCGDLVIDTNEECDDGPSNSEAPNACRSDCRAARCGDGIIDDGEVCDDGGANSDGRAGACRTACVPASCGDGVRDADEECDDGGANSDVEADACRSDCVRPSCGDGVTDDNEACDDGVAVGGPCRAACDKANACGDGVTDDDEACDDGNDNGADGCAACRVQALEQRLLLPGDGGADPLERVLRVADVAVDRLGRIYIAEVTPPRVLRLAPDGSLVTVAGSDDGGSGCVGGPATEARLNGPQRLAAGPNGDIFINDGTRICRLDPNGNLHHVIGNGEQRIPVEGDIAATASLNVPLGMAVDDTGAFFFVDASRVYRIGSDGIVRTFTGGGAGLVDDVAPLQARYRNPSSIAFDDSGRLYIGDLGNRRLRRLDVDGVVRTVAGGVAPNVTATDGDGLSVQVFVDNLRRDGDGVVIGQFNRISRFANGQVSTLAGNPVSIVSLGNTDGPATTLRLDGNVVGGVTGDSLIIAGFNYVASVDDGFAHRIAGAGNRARSIDGQLGLSISVRDITVANDELYFTTSDPAVYRHSGAVAERVVGLDDGFAGLGALPDGRVLVGTVCSIIAFEPQSGASELIAGTACGVPDDGAIARESPLPGDVGHIDVDGDGRLVFVAGQIALAIDGGVIHRLFDTPIVVSAISDLQGGAFISTTFPGDESPPSDVFVWHANAAGDLAVVSGTGDFDFSVCGDRPASSPLGLFPRLFLDVDGALLISHNSCLQRLEGDLLRTVASGRDPGVGEPLSRAPGLADALIDTPAGRLQLSGGFVVLLDEAADTVRPLLGPLYPSTYGAVERARLDRPSGIAVVNNDVLIAVHDGGIARLVRDEGVLGVALGVSRNPAPPAPFTGYLPPRATPGLLVESPGGFRVVNSDLGLAVDVVGPDPLLWPFRSAPGLTNVGGAVVLDDGRLIVADTANHCLREVRDDGLIVDFFGQCGLAGSFDDNLSSPHGLTQGASGAVYVADTGNNRVLRIVDGIGSVVIGDGSRSSAGEGSPARIFPVDAPESIDIDRFGNLYVTSRTTVREIKNVDGDADADGDDAVITVFGAGDRLTYPESAAGCLALVAVVDDGGGVVAVDRCQGFVVEIDHVAR